MKIVVCGDSWATPDTRAPGTHFTELLAGVYGHEVTCLARGAISNVGICFQIEKAITLSPDVIVVLPTSSDRIEIPIREIGHRPFLSNIVYDNEHDGTTGSEYVGGPDAEFTSLTLLSVLENLRPRKYITPEIVTAVKYYATYLHSEEIKKETDQWMLRHWYNIVGQHNIRLLAQAHNLDLQLEYNNSHWVYHTSFEIQERAASILHKVLE